MKNINLTPAIIVAAIFSIAIFSSSNANAQSTHQTGNRTLSVEREKSIGAINAEIKALETELVNIMLVAKQNNINLDNPWTYMMIENPELCAVTEKKATAKN